MGDNQLSFIIENGYNTCYIDSLLIALFYKYNESLDLILYNEPNKPEGFYLQELIKIKFIEPIKRNYSIESNILNEIRNFSIICGWSKDENITSQKKCIDFYNFISKLFNITPLSFDILELKDGVLNNSIKTNDFSYINLSITKENDTIRNLLINWIKNNITYNTSHSIIDCYKLNNIPPYIVINVNRYDEKGNCNKYKLDIMKRIKFFDINDNSQNYLKWKIHSIICYDGTNINKGHYYTLIYVSKNKWIIFDDNKIPSINNFDMENCDSNKIMADACILIYTLP